MKQFFKLKRSSNAGFTLVELIVVIAIIAILAGAGTVVYSKYIEKANIAADEQLLADIKYALSLGANSEPDKDNYSGYVVINQDADGSIQGDEALNTYMANAFGDNWKETLRLKTDGSKLSKSGFSMNSLLSSALKNENTKKYAAAVSTSTFNDPESLTDAMESLVGIASAVSFNGSGYVNSLKGLTLSDGTDALTAYTNGDSTTKANLLVWAAAKQISGDSTNWDKTNNYASLINNWNGTSSSDDVLSKEVMRYASLYAKAQYLDNLDKEIGNYDKDDSNVKKLNDSIEGIKYQSGSNIEKLDTALSAFEGELQKIEQKGGFKDYNSTNDAKAFVSIMNALSDNANEILKTNGDIKNDKYFSSGTVKDSLSALNTISGVIDNAGNGQALVLLKVENGEITVA